MSKSTMIEVENVNVPSRVSNVNAEKYEAMRGVLLRVLPKEPPGLTQAEMSAAVLPHLPQDLWPNGEKSLWWVKTVQHLRICSYVLPVSKPTLFHAELFQLNQSLSPSSM